MLDLNDNDEGDKYWVQNVKGQKNFNFYIFLNQLDLLDMLFIIFLQLIQAVHFLYHYLILIIRVKFHIIYICLMIHFQLAKECFILLVIYFLLLNDSIVTEGEKSTNYHVLILKSNFHFLLSKYFAHLSFIHIWIILLIIFQIYFPLNFSSFQ